MVECNCITKAFSLQIVGHNLSKTYSSLAKTLRKGAGLGLLNKVGHNGLRPLLCLSGSMVSIMEDMEHFDDLKLQSTHSFSTF